MTYELAGRAGHSYELGVNGSSTITRVEGATLVGKGEHHDLELEFPGTGNGYQHARVTIYFGKP